MATTLEAEAQRRDTNNAALIAEMTAPAHNDTPSDYELTIITEAERRRWIAVLGGEINELLRAFVRKWLQDDAVDD